MITVIYHSADYDGIFCREIARKFLPPDTEFIGWNFGDAKIVCVPEVNYYVLDLSPDCLNWELMGHRERDRVVWIDHHKTSIEKWPADIPGYRIDGVAACRLVWQWFKHWVPDLHGGRGGINDYWVRSTKEEFVNRETSEPLAVRLAGEYDVWDHRGDGDLEFQYGLRSETDIQWCALLAMPNLESYTLSLVEQGRLCMRYAKNMDAMWLKESWHIIPFEGVRFLAQNSVQRGSGILDSMDKPETGHDALMLYGFRGKYWTISLYHAKHRTDLDLSEIAKKYGGGGHRGACGFMCANPPFFPCLS